MTAILVYFGVGAILVGVSIISLLKYKRIAQKGIPAEGIIFGLETSRDTNSETRFPIVRFTTESNEWITETYRIGMFPGFFKVGTKVNVVYIPEKPTEFIIKSTYSNLVPTIGLLAGIISFILGIITLLNIKL